MKKRVISLSIFLLVLALASCAPAAQPEEAASGSQHVEEKAGEQALTLEDVLAMAEEGGFAQADFLAYSNGRAEDKRDDGTRNYYVDFSFPYEGDVFTLSASLWKDSDALESLYLRRESNQDSLLLYTSEERFQGAVETDMADFLAHAEDLRDAISYTVPDGLEEQPYQADTGFSGACLLTPNAYEVCTDSAPSWWYAGGMVSRFDAQEMLRWEGDAVCGVNQQTNNSSHEDMGPVDGLCAPGFLTKSEYWYYSMGDLERLEQAGFVPEKLEHSGTYWQVFLARPGDEIGYVVALNAKQYTEEDAIAFAESVRYLDETV